MNSVTNQSASVAQKRLYYEQGLQFEAFIKNLFSDKRFRLKRWRKSKLIDKDTFIRDQTYPDLELIYIGKKDYRFAVECKWRSRFYYGKTKWADEANILIYKEFQQKTGMPVFIAIGIGGTASNPERLFVTPLDNICHDCEVYQHKLIPFKRNPTEPFDYNTTQLTLW
jgi:hypothetical protein